jgi:hypothetical protein
LLHTGRLDLLHDHRRTVSSHTALSSPEVKKIFLGRMAKKKVQSPTDRCRNPGEKAIKIGEKREETGASRQVPFGVNQVPTSCRRKNFTLPATQIKRSCVSFARCFCSRLSTSGSISQSTNGPRYCYTVGRPWIPLSKICQGPFGLSKLPKGKLNVGWLLQPRSDSETCQKLLLSLEV